MFVQESCFSIAERIAGVQPLSFAVALFLRSVRKPSRCWGNLAASEIAPIVTLPSSCPGHWAKSPGTHVGTSLYLHPAALAVKRPRPSNADAFRIGRPSSGTHGCVRKSSIGATYGRQPSAKRGPPISGNRRIEGAWVEIPRLPHSQALTITAPRPRSSVERAKL